MRGTLLLLSIAAISQQLGCAARSLSSSISRSNGNDDVSANTIYTRTTPSGSQQHDVPYDWGEDDDDEQTLFEYPNQPPPLPSGSDILSDHEYPKLKAMWLAGKDLDGLLSDKKPLKYAFGKLTGKPATKTQVRSRIVKLGSARASVAKLTNTEILYLKWDKKATSKLQKVGESYLDFMNNEKRKYPEGSTERAAVTAVADAAEIWLEQVKQDVSSFAARQTQQIA